MFGTWLGFRGSVKSCGPLAVSLYRQGATARMRCRQGDCGNGYGSFDPCGRALDHGGKCRRLGWSTAGFGSFEEKMGFPSKDDGLTFGQDPKALPGDVARRSVAFDRIVAFRGIVRQIEVRVLRHEACAVFMNKVDVRKKIQQLGL